MAEPEKWTFCNEKGAEQHTVNDPEKYMSGWNLFFETNRIGETNFLPAVLIYFRLLGQNPTGTETEKHWNMKTPTPEFISGNKNLALLVLDFYGLVEAESYQRIYNSYEAGNITPELAEILNHQPQFNAELFNAIMENGGFREIVLNMAKSGKIDFSRRTPLSV